ncbi:homoserine kinase [soil metagenome]|nr:homoserine kinase [Trueperaceae bacterium]
MIRVRVPATSANLGPGFDCLGLAVDLFLEVEGRPAQHDRFRYTGPGSVASGPDNLVHRGFRAAHATLGLHAPPFAFEARNAIPLARGLGSSSAALVAGAAIADALQGGLLGRDGVFQLVAGIEGHPDNVGPAVYGGFTVAALRADGGYETAVLKVPPTWRLLFGVPAFELPTEQARAALPDVVSRNDAVRTASRAALWAVAVARDEPALLRTASIDVLHEPYREPLVPGLAAARAALRAAGAYAAFLSGAGPSIGVVAPDGALPACRAALARFAGPDGCILELGVGDGYALDVLAT